MDSSPCHRHHRITQRSQHKAGQCSQRGQINAVEDTSGQEHIRHVHFSRGHTDAESDSGIGHLKHHTISVVVIKGCTTPWFSAPTSQWKTVGRTRGGRSVSLIANRIQHLLVSAHHRLDGARRRAEGARVG
eukprot:1169354-Prymnesium_polylepis.1